MAYITTEVEVDLDGHELDIIEHLSKCIKMGTIDGKSLKSLCAAMIGYTNGFKPLPADTLDQVRKIEYIHEIFDKFSVEELYERLS